VSLDHQDWVGTWYYEGPDVIGTTVTVNADDPPAPTDCQASQSSCGPPINPGQPGTPSGPGSSGGGFGGGGGVDSSQRLTPKQRACVKQSYEKAYRNEVDLALEGFVMQTKGFFGGVADGIILGCAITSEVGCIEGGAAGAIPGAIGGVFEGTIDAYINFFKGIRSTARQLNADIVACTADTMSPG
jgi:hypothetical protein